MLALFRAQGSRIPTDSKKNCLIKAKKVVKKNDKLIDVFDFANHQRLPMMFYSFCQESNNAPSFCVEPRLVKFL